MRPSSERGSVLILVAVSLTMLLAMVSVAFNSGFMFDLRERLSAAADGAALSAALEVQRGNSANVSTFANREVNAAVSSGLLPTGISVTARLCSAAGATCLGSAASSAQHVEVILTKNQTTFFGGLLGATSMTPRARAVAGTGSSPACIYALASSGVGITINNNADMNAQNCTIMANSSASNAIDVGNNGDIDATGGSVGTTGNCTVGNNGAIVPACQTSVPPANDPLAGLPAPTVGSCTSYSLGNNGNGTINPGTYCGISLSNNATLTMNPGIYVLTGSTGLSLSNNTTVTGSGVMIYNSGTGSVSLSNNSTVTLSAPTTGTYAGVLIYQAPSNTAAFAISNNGTFNLSGALYFPSANVSIANNGAAATDCSLIVAQRITLSNNAVVNPRSTCSSFGGSPIRRTALAE